MAIKAHGAGKVLKACKCANQARCRHGWTLRYWADGHQTNKTFRDTVGPDKRVHYGSGKALAEDFQAKLFAGKRAGDVSFADTKGGDVPFLPYCEAWIARRQAPATRSCYTHALAHLRAALVGRTLRQVAGDREGVQAMIEGVPGTYQAKARIVLVSPCNEALKQGRITGHLLRGLVVQVPTRRAKVILATNEQLEIMAAELEDRGLLVWLGALAGTRLGESLGVNIADFTDGGTNLRLARQRMADGSLSHLKSRKDGDFRDIPVPAILWAKVQAAVQAAQPNSEGYFFPAEWRTSSQFQAARQAAGLPAAFTPHHLRHLYASVLLTNLVPITDVAHFLGHRNINTTFATYGHLVAAASDRAREVLDSRWAA
jgi:integrase